MKWRKLGLVYGPDGSRSWAAHSALTPTPLLLDEERLRVYAGFRDKDGVSRVGWVDLHASNPTRVLRVGTEPALDIGRPGCFDDNGVILGDIVRLDDRLRIYYIGFQLVNRVKFLAFTGVAESVDGGDLFTRLKETPVLDRAGEGLYIRAIHSVQQVNGRWRIWYAVGSDWARINNIPYPSYHIRTLVSDDGLSFGDEGVVCIADGAHQYRIGRPRVWQSECGHHMLFTYGTLDGQYLPGYAWSPDGIAWKRDDSLAGLDLSAEGWDSRMLCYPAPVRVKDQCYLFYNGNDFGRDGFGCAILDGMERTNG